MLIITFLLLYCIIEDYGVNRLTSQLTNEMIVHAIEPQDLIVGGKVELLSLLDADSSFVVQMNYYIDLGIIEFEGSTDEVLPGKFLTEAGYKELEQMRSFENEEARLEFLGRQDVDTFEECYKVHVVPHNGKWSGIVYYHPDVESVGWVRLEVEIMGYGIVSNLLSNEDL